MLRSSMYYELSRLTALLPLGAQPAVTIAGATVSAL
jgi:hypothetical protein